MGRRRRAAGPARQEHARQDPGDAAERAQAKRRFWYEHAELVPLPTIDRPAGTG
ncbi:hypothetical protein AB0D10_13650 [Kitasatospora sp. NPDC048545]|uniref:hypothetical protein n=1 Tax=Kitasatospora sp. NPDC048545 TaxID=3157208 RepID=UPI0033C268A2